MSELQFLNAAFSGLVAGALSVIVFRTDIKEGPVLKIGLVGMIFSNLITAMLIFEGSQNFDAYALTGVVSRIGILLICVGLIGRAVDYAKRTKCTVDPEQRTRSILRGIIEPVNDVAHLFRASEPAPLEREK